MADELRRSGRATKGQHTKNQELDVPTPVRAKPCKRTKAVSSADGAEDEEDNDEIRCPCGVQKDIDGWRMVQCDKCDTWQHNRCMGLPENKKALPDMYQCEQCKPDEHVELLDAIAKGEKPWQKRGKKRGRPSQRQSSNEGDENTKKTKVDTVKKEESQEESQEKGEKVKTQGDGPKSRESMDKTSMGPPPLGVKTDVNKKRKLRGETMESDVSMVDASPMSMSPHAGTPSAMSVKANSPDSPGPRRKRARAATKTGSPRARSKSRTKKQKSASPAPPNPAEINQTTLLDRPEQLLSEGRRKCAELLIKSSEGAINNLIKQGRYHPGPETSVSKKATEMGMAIEHATHMNHSNHPSTLSTKYKIQFHTMYFNLGKNPMLCANMLAGILTPDQFSMMATQDMRTEEQKREDEEIQAKSEKKHIREPEDENIRRIRRTHKGEEYVGGDGANDARPTVTVPSPPSGRRDSVSMLSVGDLALVSPGMSISQGFSTNGGVGAGSPTGDGGFKQALRIDPNAAATHQQSERKSSTTTTTPFNIQDVWSSVHQSPLEPVQPTSSSTVSIPSHQHHHASASTNVIADPEIDALLKDDDDEDINMKESEDESPPYSPTDIPPATATNFPVLPVTTDPSIIWDGTIFMPNVTDGVKGQAKHIGSSSSFEWTPSNVMDGTIPKLLKIVGRIDEVKAMQYLWDLQNVENQTTGKSTSTDTDVMVVYPTPQMHHRGAQNGNGYGHGYGMGVGDANEEENKKNLKEFETLWTYFKSRGKSGVIDQVPDKDGNKIIIYLLPVDFSVSSQGTQTIETQGQDMRLGSGQGQPEQGQNGQDINLGLGQDQPGQGQHEQDMNLGLGQDQPGQGVEVKQEVKHEGHHQGATQGNGNVGGGSGMTTQMTMAMPKILEMLEYKKNPLDLGVDVHANRGKLFLLTFVSKKSETGGAGKSGSGGHGHGGSQSVYRIGMGGSVNANTNVNAGANVGSGAMVKEEDGGDLVG